MIILLVFGITFAVFTWAIFWRNSSLLITTHWRGPRDGPLGGRLVALTFDDGPDPRITPAVLEALAREGAKATFFCIGEAARRYPELVRRIHAEGHLVASHSHEHDWRMNFWHPNRVARSLVASGHVLARATEFVPRFYRPPVGIKSPAQALMGWKLGLEFVGWTRSARDGRGPVRPEALGRLAGSARGGDIILLHDGKPTLADGEPAVRQTAETFHARLPELIRGLRARGLEPARLDELLQISGALEPGARRERKAMFVQGILPNLKSMTRRLAREHLSPLQLAMGVALGVLIGCTPFFGLHALIGLVAAIKLRLNKLAVFAGTNITNPLTGPLVIFFNIQVGCRLVTGRWLPLTLEALRGHSVFSFGNRMLLYWIAGFPLAATATAALVGGVCYLGCVAFRWRRI